MGKQNGLAPWVEAGYDLFALEGMNGIQVERLARILQRNKSGFYHYFGDMESYSSDLLKLHKRKADAFFIELQSVRSIDPDYLNLIVKYKTSILFQIQCYRSGNAALISVAEKINLQEEQNLRGLWAQYIGFDHNPELANRFFVIIRDMFHGRVNSQNFDYSFLLTIATEAKSLVQQIADENDTGQSSHLDPSATNEKRVKPDFIR